MRRSHLLKSIVDASPIKLNNKISIEMKPPSYKRNSATSCPRISYLTKTRKYSTSFSTRTNSRYKILILCLCVDTHSTQKMKRVKRATSKRLPRSVQKMPKYRKLRLRFRLRKCRSTIRSHRIHLQVLIRIHRSQQIMKWGREIIIYRIRIPKK